MEDVWSRMSLFRTSHKNSASGLHVPFRAPSSPPETPMPMYMIPMSSSFLARISVFSYLWQTSVPQLHACCQADLAALRKFALAANRLPPQCGSCL